MGWHIGFGVLQVGGGVRLEGLPSGGAWGFDGRGWWAIVQLFLAKLTREIENN